MDDFRINFGWKDKEYVALAAGEETVIVTVSDVAECAEVELTPAQARAVAAALVVAADAVDPPAPESCYPAAGPVA